MNHCLKVYSVFLLLHVASADVLLARSKRQSDCLIPGITCGQRNRGGSGPIEASLGLGQSLRIPFLENLKIPGLDGDLGSSGGLNVRNGKVNLGGRENVFGVLSRNRGLSMNRRSNGAIGVSGEDSLGFLGGLLGIQQGGNIDVQPDGSTVINTNSGIPGIFETGDSINIDPLDLRGGGKRRTCIFGDLCFEQAMGGELN